MWRFIFSIQAAWWFRGYKPQPISILATARWIKQFDRKNRKLAIRLLQNVIYLPEKQTRKILVDQNAALVKRLNAAGLPSKNLIYVQIDDAGSSSPVMLNILRDAAQLERSGCRFVDAHDSLRLNEIMNEIGEGALIYVDDFVGTGNQFCKERDFVARHFVGTFSEFLLVPSICEEATYELGKRGIEAFAGHVHSKAERPLHPNSSIFSQAEKDEISEVCRSINRRFG